MQALVTGATGLIGFGIVKELLKRGHNVSALVRNLAQAKKVLPQSVTLIEGDITLPESLPVAMQQMDWVFHAAGMPEQWQRDESIFDKVNKTGTVNVLAAAQQAQVKRVIYTSTMDVFAAPRGGELVETHVDQGLKPSAYERSKQAAEREAQKFLDQGLDIVFLNPAAVYGPSPVHVSLNTFFIELINRRVPLLPPGGVSVLYVDGCAQAHVAAAERAPTGERYLLADKHFSMRDLARATLTAAGKQNPPKAAPGWLLKPFALITTPFARMLGVAPLIAPGQLSFLMWNAHVNSKKAQEALGFHPTPFSDGIAHTIASLRAQGHVK